MNANIKSFFLTLIVVLVGTQFASCQKRDTDASADDANIKLINESYQTHRDESQNVDSPAIWHGPDGQHWLIATAKSGNALLVFDATDGSTIKRIGKEGTARGQLKRPNGIAVKDNLVFVVERDNARVQVLRLPEFRSLGFFGTKGEDPLILPYGISVDRTADQTYDVFITDNYNPYMEGYPAESELDKRVHEFNLKVEGNNVQAQVVNVFGDTYTDGALHSVESIWTDRANDRLLIADEAHGQHDIKVYNLEGKFTGKIISNEYFEAQPEGIALYKCSDGTGYWIMTDQQESPKNRYQVFDRQTLDYIGGFKGKVTRNTDGVWLTQKSFGPFKHGAFYPVHNDGSVTAMSWTAIADSLSLKKSCTE